MLTVARAVAHEALTLERIARVEPHLLGRHGAALFGGGTETLGVHVARATVAAAVADALEETVPSSERDYEELAVFVLHEHQIERVKLPGPFKIPSGPSNPAEWKRAFDRVVDLVFESKDAATAWARDTEREATDAVKMGHADQAAQVSHRVIEGGLTMTSGLRSRTLRSLRRTLETYSMVNGLDALTEEDAVDELQDAERTHCGVKPVSNEPGRTQGEGERPDA